MVTDTIVAAVVTKVTAIVTATVTTTVTATVTAAVTATVVVAVPVSVAVTATVEVTAMIPATVTPTVKARILTATAAIDCDIGYVTATVVYSNGGIKAMTRNRRQFGFGLQFCFVCVEGYRTGFVNRAARILSSKNKFLGELYRYMSERESKNN